MKALSIHPYYASAIVTGYKSIEVRTWTTDYRGDILICSTAKKYHKTVPSHALGIVRLVDMRPLEKKDLPAALLDKSDFSPGLYAWVLDNNRLIEPIPVKGKLSLWEFKDEDLIKIIPREIWAADGSDDDDAEEPEWWHKYWEPLVT